MSSKKTSNKITGGKGFAGTVRIPASKSHGQRALACALINPHVTEITGLGNSDDEQAVLQVIQQLGASVAKKGDLLLIRGIDFSHPPTNRLSIGESGLATRMLTPLIALFQEPIEITGAGSVVHRSMTFFDRYLPTLGVDFRSNDGKLPFLVRGPLEPRSISVDASGSSQYITGLIYAFVASRNTGQVIVQLEQPTSIPYIELSLEVLHDFGVFIQLSNSEIVFDLPYVFSPASIRIEGDWSSASFFLVAAAIRGSVVVTNLRVDSLQADRALMEVLRQYGARLTETSEYIRVESASHHAFACDATHCPDLFPALAVLAVFGDGVSRINGVSRLFNKESNRAESIQVEFHKMGIQVDIQGDTMLVFPQQTLLATEFDSHGDHRIAMACAILASFAAGESTITNAGVVSKSYPEFFAHFQQLQVK